MSAVLTSPWLCQGQTVGFIGGAGVIKNYKVESGIWLYLVEMELGPEPEVGRVGCETMVWLPEADLSLSGYS